MIIHKNYRTNKMCILFVDAVIQSTQKFDRFLYVYHPG